MREYRALAFPVAWVLGGAAAGLATFRWYLGVLAFLPAAAILLIPESMEQTVSRRRLGAMGIVGRLPAGLSPTESYTPAVSLLVAIACAILLAGFATADLSTSFPEAGRNVLFAFAAILGFVSLCVMATFLLRQRESLQRLAQTRGWLTLDDDPELCLLLANAEPVRFGHPPHLGDAVHMHEHEKYQHKVSKVLVGRMGKVPFRIFEYTYTLWARNPRKPKQLVKSTRVHHVLAATLPVAAPDLTVRALDARIGTAGGPPDVAIAQGEFSATFSVQANDPEFVYEWLNQGVVDVFLALGPKYALNWNQGDFVLYGPGSLGTVDAMLFYGGLQQMTRMMPFEDNPPRAFSIPGKPGTPSRKPFLATGPKFMVRKGPHQER